MIIFKKFNKYVKKGLFAVFLGFATVGTTFAGSLDWNVGVTSQYLWRLSLIHI